MEGNSAKHKIVIGKKLFEAKTAKTSDQKNLKVPGKRRKLMTDSPNDKEKVGSRLDKNYKIDNSVSILPFAKSIPLVNCCDSSTLSNDLIKSRTESLCSYDSNSYEESNLQVQSSSKRNKPLRILKSQFLVLVKRLTEHERLHSKSSSSNSSSHTNKKSEDSKKNDQNQIDDLTLNIKIENEEVDFSNYKNNRSSSPFPTIVAPETLIISPSLNPNIIIKKEIENEEVSSKASLSVSSSNGQIPSTSAVKKKRRFRSKLNIRKNDRTRRLLQRLTKDKDIKIENQINSPTLLTIFSQPIITQPIDIDSVPKIISVTPIISTSSTTSNEIENAPKTNLSKSSDLENDDLLILKRYNTFYQKSKRLRIELVQIDNLYLELKSKQTIRVDPATIGEDEEYLFASDLDYSSEEDAVPQTSSPSSPHENIEQLATVDEDENSKSSIKCKYCSRFFTDTQALLLHESLHKSKKRHLTLKQTGATFNCPHCSMSYVKKAFYNIHMKKKHPKKLISKIYNSASPSMYAPEFINKTDSGGKNSAPKGKETCFDNSEELGELVESEMVYVNGVGAIEFKQEILGERTDDKGADGASDESNSLSILGIQNDETGNEGTDNNPESLLEVLLTTEPSEKSVVNERDSTVYTDSDISSLLNMLDPSGDRSTSSGITLNYEEVEKETSGSTPTKTTGSNDSSETTEIVPIINCQYCSKTFSSSQALEKHENSSHFARIQKPYRCMFEHCPERFDSSKSLEAHRNLVHKRSNGQGVLTKTPATTSTTNAITNANDETVSENSVETGESVSVPMEESTSNLVGESKYSCGECGGKYKSLLNYVRHMWNHGEARSESQVCFFCPKRFSDRKAYTNHIKAHTYGNKKKSRTLELNSMTKSQDSLLPPPPSSSSIPDILEDSSKNIVRPFPCQSCDLVLNSLDDYISHMYETHEKSTRMRFRCPYSECFTIGKTFHLIHHFRSHIHAHFRKEAVCGECGESFPNISDLKKHEKSKHSMLQSILSLGKDLPSRHTLLRELKLRTCGDCNSKVDDTLEQHCCSIGESDFVRCFICFSAYCCGPQGLREHLSGHKTIPCRLCTKLVYVDKLVEHLKSHMGEEYHECKVCSRAYPNKQSLDKHNTTHIHRENVEGRGGGGGDGELLEVEILEERSGEVELPTYSGVPPSFLQSVNEEQSASARVEEENEVRIRIAQNIFESSSEIEPTPQEHDPLSIIDGSNNDNESQSSSYIRESRSFDEATTSPLNIMFNYDMGSNDGVEIEETVIYEQPILLNSLTTQNETQDSFNSPQQTNLYPVENASDTSYLVPNFEVSNNGVNEVINFAQVQQNETLNNSALRCFKCNKVSLTFKETRSHLYVKHQLYLCLRCFGVYKERDKFIRHNRKHLGSSSFDCMICYKLFEDKEASDAHRKTESHLERLSASVTQRSKFISPPLVHIAPKEITRSTSNDERNSLSLQSLLESPTLSSGSVDKSVKRSALRVIKDSVPVYYCSTCPQFPDAPFLTITSLEEHYRLLHKEHMCKICLLLFTNQTACGEHLKSHVGESELDCLVCMIPFRSIASLRVHKKSKMHSDRLEEQRAQRSNNMTSLNHTSGGFVRTSNRAFVNSVTTDEDMPRIVSVSCNADGRERVNSQSLCQPVIHCPTPTLKYILSKTIELKKGSRWRQSSVDFFDEIISGSANILRPGEENEITIVSEIRASVQRPFGCILCEAEFFSKEEAEAHMVHGHTLPQFQVVSSLLIQIYSEMGRKPQVFRCLHCKKLFINNRHYVKHWHMYHSRNIVPGPESSSSHDETNSSYICLRCDLSMGSREDYEAHFHSHHASTDSVGNSGVSNELIDLTGEEDEGSSSSEAQTTQTIGLADLHWNVVQLHSESFQNPPPSYEEAMQSPDQNFPII